MVSIISIKSKKLTGEIFVPGDKSISHRALILGACAVGKTTIEHNLAREHELLLPDKNELDLLDNNKTRKWINKNNPSFTDIAEAYGIKALSCDNTKNLEQTIKKFIDYKKPILCELYYASRSIFLWLQLVL